MVSGFSTLCPTPSGRHRRPGSPPSAMVPTLTDESRGTADAGGASVAHPMLRSLAQVTVVLALLTPAGGWAAPFKFTPTSFQQWLNANPGRWQEGRRVIFSNLSRCSRSWMFQEHYICLHGFVKITDPMGSRVCRLQEVSWSGIKRRLKITPDEASGSGRPDNPNGLPYATRMPDPDPSTSTWGRPPGVGFRQGECRWQ